MIFKHPDTVPQMRSKPIHFHKKAKNIFGNIVVQTDKILFASDIFVKHFCWDFQTCLSQIFFADKGAWGAPMDGGAPHQPKSVATSRNQPKSVTISHRGGGGDPFSWKIIGPGGLGPTSCPTPLQLENSWPRRQLPGAYGGPPEGSPLSPW